MIKKSVSSSYLLLFFLSGCGFHLVLGDKQTGEIKICDRNNCEKQPREPESWIKVTIDQKKAAWGTIVKSRWFYLEKDNTRLIREKLSDLEGATKVVHLVRTPKIGYWKAGRYKVIVEVDGKKEREVFFEVAAKEKVEAKDIPTEKDKPDQEKFDDILDDDF
ncbi:MAG: hypothetical protein PF689_03505 [Deltaproteobacteria bacterium]|jgi:hypothetical protein|nr:hypothetical protein [Deltaproteobacteria bacterium]